MRTWIEWLNKRRLWKKLFAFVVLLSIIPLLVLSVFMRSTAENSIMALATQSANSAMDIMVYNISQQFQKYYYLAYFISRDEQLKSLMELPSPMAFNRDSEQRGNLYTLMRGYQQSVPDVRLVAVALENGLLLTGMSRAASGCDFAGQSWYERCKAEPDTARLIQFRANTGPFREAEAPVDTIMACQAILDDAGGFIGVSMVIMPSSVLAQSSTNVLDRNGSFVYIADGNGALIYSPIVGEQPVVLDERQYMRIVRHIPSFDWTVTGMMHIKSALDNIQNMNRLVYLSCILVAVIIAISAAVLSSRILRPIFNLNRLMKRTQDGDLSVRFQPSGDDEINELGVSFNAMLGKITGLLDQIYVEQKAKRKAEVAALQANIKPHFLYNTLDTLCWMASQYRADDIVETIESLSTLFRIALSKGNELIPVEQEVSHVTSYLQIQKVRYEDMMEYAVDIAEDCQGYLVQKMILQPLVENSIYHGIKESGRSGFIRVSVTKHEDALLLRVSDDGRGIPPERLAALRAVLAGDAGTSVESNGYGIANVQERLVLTYGRAFGLFIESTGRGAECLIRHPLVRANEQNMAQ